MVDASRTARLLLVEDNPDNLEVLTFILSEKYHVSSHVCAAEALTALEAVKPDLVVLDIAMTPIDGLQCLQAIRAVPGYASIPAIALTAFAREVEKKTFLAAGFQAVVTKPILDHREMFAVITSVLNTGGAEPRPGRGDHWSDQSGLGHPVLTARTSDDMMADCGPGQPFKPGPA